MAAVQAVTNSLPEMAKNPAEFFVKMKLHGITVPDESIAVSAPIAVPYNALLLIDRLLMEMGIIPSVLAQRTK